MSKFVDYWVGCAVLCAASQSLDMHGVSVLDNSSDEKLNILAEYLVDIGLLAENLEEVALVSCGFVALFLKKNILCCFLLYIPISF